MRPCAAHFMPQGTRAGRVPRVGAALPTQYNFLLTDPEYPEYSKHLAHARALWQDVQEACQNDIQDEDRYVRFH